MHNKVTLYRTWFVLDAWPSSDGKPPWYVNHPLRPTQPSTLGKIRNEYWPKCGKALYLRNTGRHRYSICECTCRWQVKLDDPSLTCAIPESLRGKSVSVWSTIELSCLLYFTYFSVKDLICHNSSCSSGSQTSVTVGSFSFGDSARRRSRSPLLCGVCFSTKQQRKQLQYPHYLLQDDHSPDTVKLQHFPDSFQHSCPCGGYSRHAYNTYNTVSETRTLQLSMHKCSRRFIKQ